ncbi:hypothetical protein CCMA1212_000482 [Trichoderma ghanense]|uniref:Uncharacterized protein n=1 Tax=Trichoderma ghanense TaxID=65468 RepID=A0ABY2HIK1_9HYPO
MPSRGLDRQTLARMLLYGARGASKPSPRVRRSVSCIEDATTAHRSRSSQLHDGFDGDGWSPEAAAQRDNDMDISPVCISTSIDVTVPIYV